MKILLSLIGIFVVVNALTSSPQWLAFKRTHSKSYANLQEENYRLSVFQSNIEKIEEHNARYKNGDVSYYMGVNQFADLTAEEFMSFLNKQIANKPLTEAPLAQFSDEPIPDSIDWRSSGAVLEVKNQGTCGSCWSFSATGALEALNFLANNVSISLSEQELIDCTLLYGNVGCGGGNMGTTFKYVKSKGITSEAKYPYEGIDGNCRRNTSNIVFRIKGYQTVAKDEESLKRAIATVGPVSVGMEATDNLRFYKGGILSDVNCTNAEREMNHGVLAVGYGSENNQDYWIVKNSWGVHWGEEGFFRLQRNPYQCCIVCDSHFPTL